MFAIGGIGEVQLGDHCNAQQNSGETCDAADPRTGPVCAIWFHNTPHSLGKHQRLASAPRVVHLRETLHGGAGKLDP